MNAEQIAEIEARANAATGGPWGIERTDMRNWIGPMRRSGTKVAAIIVNIDRVGLVPEALSRNDNNSDFIAHARTDIPALIAALRAERAKVAAMDQALWEANSKTQ